MSAPASTTEIGNDELTQQGVATGTELNGVIIDEIQRQHSHQNGSTTKSTTAGQQNDGKSGSSSSKSWIKLNVGGKVFES
jgi:hypothetical protein